MLERLDLVQDERDELFSSFETTRLVNNVNLHWQVGQKLELGTQIGARYAKSTIDGERYSGWSTLLGFDGRRELTRMLDIGAHATWLDSEAGGTTRALGRLRRRHQRARNVWISVGYNFEGFRDEHFDASRYTAQGPYVRFRMKVDQDSFKDLDLSRLRPGGRERASARAATRPRFRENGAGRHGEGAHASAQMVATSRRLAVSARRARADGAGLLRAGRVRGDLGVDAGRCARCDRARGTVMAGLPGA